MVRLDLPWDLVEEILSRIPATSLIRLRFTCKRWNALFKDPEFIRKQLDKAAKQNLVLMLSHFRVYSWRVDDLNEICNPSIKFSKLIRRSLNKSERVDITEVFHCNGLLLCSTKEEIKTKLMVVNPCTGQTRWIEPISFYSMSDRFALGYENNNKNSYESYKILSYSKSSDCNQLKIFELKSNSWRVLDNIPPNEALRINGRGMSLKGTTYWLSCLNYDILSFDFTTERFRRLCLPFKVLGNIALSVFREEKLSLLHRNYDTQKMEIWVTNKIDDNETVFSWSKSFTLGLWSQFDNTLNFSLNFLIDEEKKVDVACGRNVENHKDMIYIVGKHSRRKFVNYSNQCLPYIFSYVPSLVSLNPPM